MVNFGLGEEIEKDAFCLVTSVGQRKTSESLLGVEPQTFEFRARSAESEAKLKNSSPKYPSADCWLTVDQQLADSQLTNDQQTADIRPTVG